MSTCLFFIYATWVSGENEKMNAGGDSYVYKICFYKSSASDIEYSPCVNRKHTQIYVYACLLKRKVS